MASLQKKGESWYCQFMHERQRHTYTIGKVDEAEANTTAARIDYILMRIRQQLIEVPLGMDILTFIKHDGKPPVTVPSGPISTSLSQLRDAYLKTFGNGALELSTLRTVKLHLKNLAETIGDGFPLRTLDTPVLQGHIERRQPDVAAVTIKKEIDTLRAAWNWGCRMKLTQGTFPNSGLVYPKGEDKLPFMTMTEIQRRIAAGGNADELWECLYLSNNEIADLLDHVKERPISPWIYPAFVLVAHTGARRSEMMRVKPEDVDLEGGTVTIREKKRTRGRRTTRRVPLSDRLSEVLQGWMQNREADAYLFGPGKRVLSSQTPQKAFRRAVKNSVWKAMKGWHVLRHSFISALASKGVDQRIIDDFVGHQTEEQRRRYRHLYPSTQAEAIKEAFG